MSSENCGNIEGRRNSFGIGNFPLKHLVEIYNPYNIAQQNPKPPIEFFTEYESEDGILYVTVETAAKREARIDAEKNAENDNTENEEESED